MRDIGASRVVVIEVKKRGAERVLIVKNFVPFFLLLMTNMDLIVGIGKWC